MYATDSQAGQAWLIKHDGTKTLLDEGLKHPTGIALTPDGLWLAVMESRSHWGYSYRVRPDGKAELKQKFFWAHVPDWADDSGAGGMCMDRHGHPYVATRLGVQVFDRNGRSRGILPLPAGEATSVCFGGARFDTLFVTRRRQALQTPHEGRGCAPIHCTHCTPAVGRRMMKSSSGPKTKRVTWREIECTSIARKTSDFAPPRS